MSGFNNQQSLYDILFRQTTHHIYSNAQKNQQRAVYCEHMSRNGFVNQDVDELVRFITMHVEVADATRHVTDQDVANIIEGWVLQHLCSIVINNPGLQQGMSNDALQRAQVEARNYQTRAFQLERDYNQAMQQQRNFQPGNRFFQQQPGLGMGGGAPMGGIPSFGQTAVASPPGFHQQQPVQNSGFRSAFSAPAGRVPGGAADRGTATPAQPAPAPVAQPVQQTYVTQPAVQVPIKPPVEGPDMTEPQPFDNFRIKGEQWMPAHKATYALADNRRYRMFDPNIHILYLVKGTNGEVREEFMELDVESEYLRNEIKKISPAGVYGGDGAPAAKGPARLINLPGKRNYVHPCTEILNQLKSQSELIRGIIMQSKTPIIISGKNDAVAHLRATHLLGDSPVDYNTYITEDPVVIRAGTGLNLATLNLSPVGLAEQLTNLRATGEVDPAVINKIDRRLTAMTNSLMQDGLGWAGYSIDSYIDDTRDLLKVVQSKLGNDLLGDLTRSMRLVLAAALSVDDTLERKREWCNENVLAEFNPTKLDVLLFQDVYVIAYSSMKVSEIFPGIMPTYTRLDPVAHETQHQLCTALLDARDENGGVSPAMIMSEDGASVLVSRNPASGDISVRLG